MKRQKKAKTVITRSTCISKPSLPASVHIFFFWIVLISIIYGLCAAPVAGASENSEKKKQEKPYALLFGTVWGPDDRPVYGVRILIRRADKKRAHWELESNHMGEFAQRLPAGKMDYIVWADLKGYKSLDGRKLSPGDEVKAHTEFDERVDIGVHLK